MKNINTNVKGERSKKGFYGFSAPYGRSTNIQICINRTKVFMTLS